MKKKNYADTTEFLDLLKKKGFNYTDVGRIMGSKKPYNYVYNKVKFNTISVGMMRKIESANANELVDLVTENERLKSRVTILENKLNMIKKITRFNNDNQ